MRNEDVSVSRRTTDSKLTLSKRLWRVVNKHKNVKAREARHTRQSNVYTSSGAGGRDVTTREWSYFVLHQAYDVHLLHCDWPICIG